MAGSTQSVVSEQKPRPSWAAWVVFSLATIGASIFFAWLCRFQIHIFALVFAVVLLSGYPLYHMIKPGRFRPFAATLVISVVLGAVLGFNWSEAGLDRWFGLPERASE